MPAAEKVVSTRPLHTWEYDEIPWMKVGSFRDGRRRLYNKTYVCVRIVRHSSVCSARQFPSW